MRGLFVCGKLVKNVFFGMKIVSKNSDVDNVSIGEAISFIGKNEYVKANAILRKLLLVDKDNPDLLHLLGITECRIGDVGHGVRILEQLVAKYPDVQAFRINTENWQQLVYPKGPYQSDFANALHQLCMLIGDKRDDEIVVGDFSRLMLQMNSRSLSHMAKAMAELGIQLNYSAKNFTYKLDINGERRLLARLMPFQPRVIFDVGANRGEWASLAALYHPQAGIHAFEIVPETREKLMAVVGEASNVTIHPFGLADRDGDVTVHYTYEFDQTASMIEDGGRAHQLLTVPVKRGGTVTKDLGIAHIDLLKIDVEGVENLVIEGFHDFLANGSVDIIQFEYGRTSISTKFLLKDYYDMLERYDMSIGKLFPDGVQFNKYHQTHEDFLGPNYVACSNRRPDLIHALSRLTGYVAPI